MRKYISVNASGNVLLSLSSGTTIELVGVSGAEFSPGSDIIRYA